MILTTFGHGSVDMSGHVVTLSARPEVFRAVRRDGILLVYQGETDAATECTVSCARLQLLALMNGNTAVLDKMKIEGDATVLPRMVKYMSPINRNFNVIEP